MIRLCFADDDAFVSLDDLKQGDTFVESSNPFEVFLLLKGHSDEVFAVSVETGVIFKRSDFDERICLVNLDAKVTVRS
jgi:hypothetical protein